MLLAVIAPYSLYFLLSVYILFVFIFSSVTTRSQTRWVQRIDEDVDVISVIVQSTIFLFYAHFSRFETSDLKLDAHYETQ